MIAAAQGDVVIDIEKRPIMKTEVNRSNHISSLTSFIHLRVFIKKYCFFAFLITASSRNGKVFLFQPSF